MNPRAPNLKLRWRLIGVAGALAALAVACAPTAPPTPTPAPKPVEKPAEKPKAEAPKPAVAKPQYGGTLVYGDTDKMSSCYTYKVQERAAINSLSINVYETLLQFDFNLPDFRADLEVFPSLAEKWEQPDPTTYIFHLRKSAKWHDGKPFTAADVLATKDVVVSQNFQGVSTWLPFKTIEKVDDYTLKMTTEKPAPLALVGLAQPDYAHILPKHILEAGTMDEMCIGTGPYEVKSWDRTAANLVRNKNYDVKDKDGNLYPYLDGFKVIFTMTRAAMTAGVAAQELDFYKFTSTADYEAFVKQVPSVVTSQTFWSNMTYAAFFNATRKPFDNINVRKALNLLLDRHKANELAFDGKGKLGLPVVPAVKEGWGISQEELMKMPGFRKGEDLKKDQAEGQRLLKEAGLGDGFKMDHLYDKAWAGAPFAEVLPGLYKPFKIEIELRGVDNATAIKEKRAGTFDTKLELSAHVDPLLRTDAYYYSKAAQAKVDGVTDQGQDALIDQLRPEMDKKKQKELVRKIQEIVVQHQWGIWLGDYPLYMVVQPWVNGYRANIAMVRPEFYGGRQVWFDLGKLPAKRKA